MWNFVKGVLIVAAVLLFVGCSFYLDKVRFCY